MDPCIMCTAPLCAYFNYCVIMKYLVCFVNMLVFVAFFSSDCFALWLDVYTCHSCLACRMCKCCMVLVNDLDSDINIIN